VKVAIYCRVSTEEQSADKQGDILVQFSWVKVRDMVEVMNNGRRRFWKKKRNEILSHPKGWSI
jgi:DNA invertase Pin-like site-specific DNA recombinase